MRWSCNANIASVRYGVAFQDIFSRRSQHCTGGMTWEHIMARNLHRYSDLTAELRC